MPRIDFHIRQCNEFARKRKCKECYELRLEQLKTRKRTLQLLTKHLKAQEKLTSQSKYELKTYTNRMNQYENDMRHINRKLHYM